MIQFLLAEIYLAFISLGLPDSLPGSAWLIMIGLGCAPIYPCIIHSIPDHFGKGNSPALIGIQMASAYIGIMVIPPLFNLIANHISITLYPVYLLCLKVLMPEMSERLNRKTEK